MSFRYQIGEAYEDNDGDRWTIVHVLPNGYGLGVYTCQCEYFAPSGEPERLAPFFLVRRVSAAPAFPSPPPPRSVTITFDAADLPAVLRALGGDS